MNYNVLGTERTYIVNALKGIGLGDKNPTTGEYVEYNKAQLTNFLESADPAVVYEKIKLAVLHRLEQDENIGNLKSATAYDRAAVAEMLAGAKTRNLTSKDVLKNFMTDVCFSTQDPAGFNLDYTVAIIFESFMTGLAENKTLDKTEQQNAKVYLSGIYQQNGFFQWIQTLPEDKQQTDYKQLFKEYYQVKLQQELINKTKSLCNGDEQKTKKLLNNKIDADMRRYLKRTGVLINAEKFCEKSGRDAQKDLTFADVLTALSMESAEMQVIMYLESRSEEQQKDLKKNKKASEVTKENKIGNLLGKKGRKEIKTETGYAPVVDFNGAPNAKSGKKIWRGLQKLFEAVNKYYANVFEKVMAIGFTDRILKRRGRWVVFNKNNQVSEKKSDEEPWKIKVETEVSDQYLDQNHDPKVLNEVGEYYYETRSRLLADKMRLYQLEADMSDNPHQLAELEGDKKFIEARINNSEKILQHMNAMKANNASEETLKDFCRSTDNLLTDYKDINVTELYNATYRSANDEMAAALSAFKQTGKGNSKNQQAAKVKMAVEIFGLQDLYQKGEIKDADVVAMADRYISSGKCDQLIDNLRQLTPSGQQKLDKKGSFPLDGVEHCNEKLSSKDYQFMVKDAGVQIGAFVEKDLKMYAFNAKYERHQEEEAHKKIMTKAIEETYSK